ncbi:baeRF2 domain-containing protein [Actinacidiphila acidipaludis]|uniref:Uncharacterized protein n=1 Tax=Actinacidiphila acidipaludis TaxID=2873382 RepID=A0ABS7QD56_9ACTN|nr:Vms1/Ankzf1 family peptidyl-tRNA hydrolase [Streptomyces acidipaludis]MBY8879704.1 hypothetical protein [Streptomyces acidipaludis]
MHMDFLRPLYDEPGPWASLCTTPPTTDAFGAEVRELTVRGLCRALTEQGADPDTVEAVREVLGGVAPADAPHGTAVFAAHGRVVLRRPLPRALPQPVARWTALPHVVPLADAYASEVSCLVARIDRTGADFELLGGGEARPAGGAEGSRHPVHRTASADWSERHFQLKVENTWEHNAGTIAESLTDAADHDGPDLVVLAGDPHERREVFNRLPDRLRDHTAISDHGGRAAGASSDRLDADVALARDEFAHRRDRQVLDRFLAGGGEATAVGLLQLVDAAQQHRIGTLLLRPGDSDVKEEVWVGEDADRLSARRTADAPVSAPAGDALVRAAVATGADVAVLGSGNVIAPGPTGFPGSPGPGVGRHGPGAAAAASVGAGQPARGELPRGLGALLRWQ